MVWNSVKIAFVISQNLNLNLNEKNWLLTVYLVEHLKKNLNLTQTQHMENVFNSEKEQECIDCSLKDYWLIEADHVRGTKELVHQRIIKAYP